MTRKVNRGDAAALAAAVKALEARSCAEIVVEVRSRAGSYAFADWRFGSLLGLLGLIVLLFVPTHFRPISVVFDVAALIGIGVYLPKKVYALRRLMSSERERRALVRTLASSLFFERGVANTRGETGIVLLLCLLEGRIELIADRGVLAAVPALDWNRLVAKARGAEGANVAALISIVGELAELVACHLPPLDENPDELPTAPRFVVE